jgi:hypothetical protein
MLGKLVIINYFNDGYENYKKYTNEWKVVNVDKKYILELENLTKNVKVDKIHEWRVSIINNEC